METPFIPPECRLVPESQRYRRKAVRDLRYDGTREYLLVDDKCVSVLCADPPEIIDLGTDPTRS
ncbi:hypothetical protein [Nocardia sp. NPDC004415]